MSEGMRKPNYGNQDFSPLANDVYFINQKSIAEHPITEMGEAHALGQSNTY